MDSHNVVRALLSQRRKVRQQLRDHQGVGQYHPSGLMNHSPAWGQKGGLNRFKHLNTSYCSFHFQFCPRFPFTYNTWGTVFQSQVVIIAINMQPSRQKLYHCFTLSSTRHAIGRSKWRKAVLPFWPRKPHRGEVGVWFGNRFPDPDLRHFLWLLLRVRLAGKSNRQHHLRDLMMLPAQTLGGLPRLYIAVHPPGTMTCEAVPFYLHRESTRGEHQAGKGE